MACARGRDWLSQHPAVHVGRKFPRGRTAGVIMRICRSGARKAITVESEPLSAEAQPEKNNGIA